MSLPLSEKAEGDSMEICQVFHYKAPTELQSGGSVTHEGDISFDARCADCTKAFADVGAVLQHCQDTGHKPVYAASDVATPSTGPVPADVEVFLSYVNVALQRALGEKLARWGNEYIDPKEKKEPVDRSGRSLGVCVYKAFACQFGLVRPNKGDSPRLGLTVDLRAKIMRSMSVLDKLVEGKATGNDINSYVPKVPEQERNRRQWIGETVIYMHDKKCYTVTDLVYDHSASTLPVEGLGMTHQEYFSKRKNIKLTYPNAKPMIAVLGRRNQTIYFPAELVSGNDLGTGVKQQLPLFASHMPQERNDAIDTLLKHLSPRGLLPALGIQLGGGRLVAKAKVLPLPMMIATGVQVPQTRAENWAPLLKQADFKIDPRQSNTFRVVLFCNENIRAAADTVYARLRNLVNGYNSSYRFSERPAAVIITGDGERHWGAVERHFSGPSSNHENVFVLDFTKPPNGPLDTAYPVIKQMLTRNGYLSQFVNFKTCAHDSQRDNDKKRSPMILQAVARQILQKAGVRLWWINVPQSVPTPSVFIGVDVFHAPRVYDPVEKKRVSKASCAAIIVQVFRQTGDQPSQVEIYSQTYSREPGKEYELGGALKKTVSDAMKELRVNPMSCFVWRDGIGDSELSKAALGEIDAIRQGLNSTVGKPRDVPLAYIVAQKRIATKFLSYGLPGKPDGRYGAPSGTLVQGIQGMDLDTFYINGRAPSYSTAKPARFVVVQKDDKLNAVGLEELTWQLCHDYPNWTGPIKVPSVTQMAHKLAELGGSFTDSGNSMNASKLKNRIHFL